MGKTKVKLTLAGFYGLRTSPEMLAALNTEAGIEHILNARNF